MEYGGGGEYRPAVLLVPGWSDTAGKLRHAEAFLLKSGWPDTHVQCVSFRDRYGSNVEHAQEIARQVDALLASSGEERIAIVAHSMGGLATRYYLAMEPAAAVHTVVFAGTPHRGTWTAWLAWGAGGTEMRPGSAFLTRLSHRPLPRGVRAICIRTRLDTRVLPGGSAFLEGASCHTVLRPAHPRLLRHRATLRLIGQLLLDARPVARGE